MAIKIPQNQLDALPLLDADIAAAGGEIQIIGNQLTKFWASSVLAFPAAWVAHPVSGSFLLSAQLDMRAVSRFSLIGKRTFVAGGDVAQTFQFYLLYGMSDGTFELITDNAALRHRMIIDITIPIGTPTPFVFSCLWADGAGASLGTGAGSSIATVGARVKLCITNTILNNANQTYAFELWGAQ